MRYKMNGLSFQQLPAQQIQQIDPFELLGQQHQQQLEGIENLFVDDEQRIYSSAQHNLNVAWQKYNIELRYLEGSNLKIDEKRKRLNQLNQKYELAFTTIKEKIRPDVDNLNSQKQNLIQKAEYNQMLKQTRLNQIRELVDKEVIQDPYAALQEQLQILGYSYPISALKPPTEEEWAAGLVRQALLEKSPRYPTAKKKATRLQRATARATRPTRKPGTMAEGVQQIKAKAAPSVPASVSRMAGSLAGVSIPRTESKRKYRRDKITGEIQMSIDGGKTWQTIG